jgi:hypothetical protein
MNCCIIVLDPKNEKRKVAAILASMFSWNKSSGFIIDFIA